MVVVVAARGKERRRSAGVTVEVGDAAGCGGDGSAGEGSDDELDGEGTRWGHGYVWGLC